MISREAGGSTTGCDHVFTSQAGIARLLADRAIRAGAQEMRGGPAAAGPRSRLHAPIESWARRPSEPRGRQPTPKTAIVVDRSLPDDAIAPWLAYAGSRSVWMACATVWVELKAKHGRSDGYLHQLAAVRRRGFSASTEST